MNFWFQKIRIIYYLKLNSLTDVQINCVFKSIFPIYLHKVICSQHLNSNSFTLTSINKITLFEHQVIKIITLSRKTYNITFKSNKVLLFLKNTKRFFRSNLFTLNLFRGLNQSFESFFFLNRTAIRKRLQEKKITANVKRLSHK